ncbi:MAG: hypothetical protein K0S53_2688 [Bacteroidetes bacterium]|jgi:hypothetical protein|nr:hypothetical protein [Bacteroidota bacterium]
MKKIILILCVLLAATISLKAFKINVSITVLQPDASIYVNNEYKGKSSCVFELRKAQTFTIRVEKPGYKTESRVYKYNATTKSGAIPYFRDDITSVFDLKKDQIDEISPIKENKSEDLLKLETLKSDGLLTDIEALYLKDGLLGDAHDQSTKAIAELTKLRKAVNTGFITKADFIIIKNKIVKNQYDFSKGNAATDKLEVLKIKQDSGNFSKDEIDLLKKDIIISFR